MARPPSDVLTQRESQIMEVLWEHGPVCSDDVRKNLPDEPHDSSVRTMLRVLIGKGYVRADSSKRPAIYSAAVPRNKLQKKATHSLLSRFFGGSVEDLVQHLLEDEQLTPEQMTKLRRQYGSNKKKGK